MPAPRISGPRRAVAVTGALVSASALVLTGCAPAPDQDADIANDRSDYTGCIVSDSGGFDDRSFNQNSYEGLLKTKDDYGIQTKQAESQAVTDYEPNVNSMVQGGCGLTVTVGFNIADATKAAAQANPDMHFATVDDNSIDLPNVRPIIYDTSQAAFLAGYLAAGSTKTGKIATFGGMEIPTVTIFMDGFAEGVKYYNQQKHKDVTLLGWDVAKQTGTFTGDFEDTGKGKTTTQNFLNEGADIVMPVAGPVGNGAVDAVNGYNSDEPKNPARIIWVDSDGYETLSGGQEYVLTSVIKKMGDAVESAYVDDMDGKFTNQPYVGTLQNDGVGLAPYHDQEGNIPDGLKNELKDLKQQIIDGKITVSSKASPVKK
ncbi:BMP family lipoprotein [Curtobacterium sp. S6]|uniref:BMP family lipoprotein n=1 Tax=Curtobacterium sp. S6 TaxID=1479623 RepID=UPI0004AA1A6C|nr:BMP family ABC transporter substrate-binding protein [Curtobacterium sp. S6]